MVTDTDYDLNNPNDLSSFYTDEELAAFADNEAKSEEYEKYLEKEQEKLKEQAEASKEKADDDSSNTQDIIEIATASPYAAYLNEKGEWDHST